MADPTTETTLSDFTTEDISDDVLADAVTPAAQPRNQTHELIAMLDRVIFSAPLDADSENATGQYVVATVRPAGKSSLVCPVRVAGNDYDGLVKPDVPLRFYGRYLQHRQYGEQFAFTAVALHVPADRRGIVKYLQMTCPGVGKKRADDLWNAFGPDAVSVLRKTPAAVITAGVLSVETANHCSLLLRDLARFEATTLDLCSLFDGRGFPRTLIRECINRWNVRAGAVVRRDPFRLMTARLPGCGFVRCDRLWLDLGKSPTALKRQVLAAVYAISQDRSGNTWFASDEIADAIRRQLGGLADAAAVDAERAIRAAVRAPARYLRVREVSGVRWLALARHARNEDTVAGAVRRLLTRGKGKTRQRPAMTTPTTFHPLPDGWDDASNVEDDDHE